MTVHLQGLESPQNPDELYLARGDDVRDLRHRPIFTGDVVETANGLVILAQHPCAMRRGSVLVDRLLGYGVEARPSAPPRDWAAGDYRRFFLPDLMNGLQYAAEFDEICVVEAASLDPERRLAVLSEYGVNLLVQRWLYHNTRVVVPTYTIGEQTGGQFEEAELLAEGCGALIEAGETHEASVAIIDAWLSTPPTEGMPARRQMLQVPQERSTVRSGLRRQLRDWRAERQA